MENLVKKLENERKILKFLEFKSFDNPTYIDNNIYLFIIFIYLFIYNIRSVILLVTLIYFLLLFFNSILQYMIHSHVIL